MKGKTDNARRANQERVIQRWIPEATSKSAKQFRDPAARARK